MTEEQSQPAANLKNILDRMVAAFNEFHAQMTELEKRQQDVIGHIHKRIDQEKLEALKKTLDDM